MEVYYRVHKIPPLVPNLSQMNPVHTFPPNFPKTHSNISSHLHLGLPSGLLAQIITKKCVSYNFQLWESLCNLYYLLTVLECHPSWWKKSLRKEHSESLLSAPPHWMKKSLASDWGESILKVQLSSTPFIGTLFTSDWGRSIRGDSPLLLVLHTNCMVSVVNVWIVSEANSNNSNNMSGNSEL